MNHLLSIGFSVNTVQDFKSLAEKISGLGKKIEYPKGFCIQFIDSSGAGLFVQENQSEEIIGMNPHFQGKTRMKVGVVKAIIVRGEMNGAFYGWASPTKPDDPGSGIYPFVFDVPDFYTLSNIRFPFATEVQLSAFTHEIRIFNDEQEFKVAGTKLAIESFIPSGLFLPGGKAIEPPEALAIFTGRILDFQERTNTFTGKKFLWLQVKTLGGEIDVVSDIQMINKPLKVNGVIQGSFWLSGRLTNLNKS